MSKGSNNFKDYLFSEHEADQQDPKLNYKKRLKEVNLLLSINGFQELGDLFESSLFSIGQTLKTINAVVEDRQKLLESKSHLILKINSLENESLLNADKLNLLNNRINEMMKSNSVLKMKAEAKDKKQQEDFDKLKQEKEELSKVVKHLGIKESQYKHEVKKFEKNYEEVNARLKKLLQDKSLTCNCKKGNFNRDGSLSPIKATSSGNVAQFANHGQGDSIPIPGITTTNTLKNSNVELSSVNRSRDFYNLIYYAFSEKMKCVVQENTDLKDSLKILQREIVQYIDFKKILLTKLSKYSYEELSKNIKSFNFSSPIILNEKICDLDLNDSKENISNNFNQIMNSFRNLLVYDLLQVDDNREFDFDDAKKLLENNKVHILNVPYYENIKKAIDSSDLEKLNNLESLEKKLKKIEDYDANMSPERDGRKGGKKKQSVLNSAEKLDRKKEKEEDDKEIHDSILSDMDSNVIEVDTNKLLETINGLNAEISDSMNHFALLEVNINNIEADIHKLSNA